MNPVLAELVTALASGEPAPSPRPRCDEPPPPAQAADNSRRTTLAPQDVLNAITFDTGYPAGQEAALRAAITALYNGAATARETLDKVGGGTQSL